jgi:riboflavin biosynthesis pyrimidine reductase
MRLLFDAAATVPPGELGTDELARLYAFPDGPWVRANFVSTLDGSAQGGDGRSGSINGPADVHVFALLRALADVILVGAQTTRAEGYKPVVPEPWQRELRAALGLTPAPAIAVLTSSGVIDDELRAGGEAPTLVYTDLTIDAVLDDLQDKGLRHISCEGGPSVLAQLLGAGRLDELCLTVAPLMVGGHGLRIADGPALDMPWEGGLRHVIEADGMLLLRYAR